LRQGVTTAVKRVNAARIRSFQDHLVGIDRGYAVAAERAPERGDHLIAVHEGTP
jgi:hypothetical protein